MQSLFSIPFPDDMMGYEQSSGVFGGELFQRES